jgi:iron(III) transport system substrate-binding protein
MPKVFKLAFMSCLTLVFAFLASGADAAQGTAGLNVLCSASKEWCQLLAQKYENAFRVPVTTTHMATNTALDKIRHPGAERAFDVWFGGTGDPHLEAAAQDLTVSYKSPRLKELHDWAYRQATMSNYKTVGIYSGMLGFIVNDEKLKERNIKVPRCWFNLLRREYKGLVMAPNPSTSGTGYTMIETLVSLMGEEQGFAYMKMLNPHIKDYLKSGSTLSGMVARGEIPIAIAFIHDGMREKLKGVPVTVVSPCEGTGYETGSVSIVKGGNVREAKRFVDWVLSPEVQAYGAEAKQLQLPSNRNAPIPYGSPRFSDFKIYMAYDPKKFAAPEEKKRLTERWEREIFAGRARTR